MAAIGGKQTLVGYSSWMGRLFLSLAALAFATSSCTNSSSHEIGTTRASALTPTQLIATIEAHKGRTVTVAGYFTFGSDTRALWEDQNARRDAEQRRKGSWNKCITVYPLSAGARQFNGQHVRITGKATVIGKNDMRSFWTCNPVSLEDAIITRR